MTNDEGVPDEAADELRIVIGVDDDGLRSEVARLVGKYERAVGIADNLLDQRVGLMGASTGELLRDVLLKRLRDSDRFRMLRAILVDAHTDAPVDAIDGILRAVKDIRDAAAHASEWIIESDDEGIVVGFYPWIRRELRPPMKVSETELVTHLSRIEWAADWLQPVARTEPAFSTGSDWERVWRATMPAPPRQPPKLSTRAR